MKESSAAIFMWSPADGSAPRDMTTDHINASPSWFTWTNGGRDILFTAAVDGRSGIGNVEVAANQARVVWSEVETISSDAFNIGMSVASDGVTTAVVRQSFVRPPEVWAGEVGDVEANYETQCRPRSGVGTRAEHPLEERRV